EIAGGVILEEIVVHLASPWRKLDRLWQFLAALRGDESLCRFERVRMGAEAARGEPCGKHAVRRRLSRVKWFCHRAEHGFEPGRLRCRKAERGAHALLVEPHEQACRRRRAERAYRARRMEAEQIMRGSEQGADIRGRFVSGDEGPQDLRSAALFSLRNGKGGGQHGNGWMAAHPRIHIVVIESMRGCAIDKSGLHGREGERLTGDPAWAAGGIAELVDENSRRGFIGTRQGDCKPVENALSGDGLRIAVEFSRRISGDVPGECAGCSRGGRAHEGFPVEAGRFGLPSSASEMMRCWISELPSKIFVSLASRQCRSTACSVV